MARSNVFATSGKAKSYQVKLKYIKDDPPYFKDQIDVKTVVAKNQREAGTRAQEATNWNTTVVSIHPSGY